MLDAVSNLITYAVSLIALHFLVGLSVPVVIGAAVGVIVFSRLFK